MAAVRFDHVPFTFDHVFMIATEHETGTECADAINDWWSKCFVEKLRVSLTIVQASGPENDISLEVSTDTVNL